MLQILKEQQNKLGGGGGGVISKFVHNFLHP